MRHGLVHQMGTKILQRNPRELQWTAYQFLELVRLVLTGLHTDQDYIINMDQSLAPFTFDRHHTLEPLGAQKVPI